jgi:hypothetical protein
VLRRTRKSCCSVYERQRRELHERKSGPIEQKPKGTKQRSNGIRRKSEPIEQKPNGTK